jgi:putative sterol carrier protein
MTFSPPVVDHHESACDAVQRSTPLLVSALRRAPADVRPTGMRWTNAEIGAHTLASAIEGDKVVRGQPSMYDAGPSKELDERMVQQVPERDMGVLADRVEEQTAAFLATCRSLPGDRPLVPERATVSTFVGLLASDHHLHGGQFAEAAGAEWTGDVADLHSPLSLVLMYAFAPEAAGRFRGTYTLRLRGVASLTYAVEDGRLRLGVTGRTDCTISSDPQTFLRLGIGAVSQVRAALTAKVRVSGRKPWLAVTTNRLFPPIPHGGVAG